MATTELIESRTHAFASAATDQALRSAWFRRWTFWRKVLKGLGAAAILLPSLWGFGTKFVELIAIYRGEVDGAFAIAPIMNYLLASSGFALLLCWAACNGMFRDIEKPKHTMLETEAQLDFKSLRHCRFPTE